ncbi:MAG: Cna B-type domain-containing protein [Porcipelethomonas sp.]
MRGRLAAFFTLIVMCVCMGGMSVCADSPHGSLLVECRCGDAILSSMKWDLYRIADITDNNGYELSGDFSDYPVTLNNLSTSQTIAAAETLEAYAQVDGVSPIMTLITDCTGNAEFENLEYGVYLLSGTPMTMGGKYYLPTPSIVVLSDDNEIGSDNIHWTYNVSALPKLKVLAEADRIYSFSGTVKVQWQNDRKETRPDSVDITLLRDGEPFKTVTVDESCGWSYTWENMSSKYKWTVIEGDIPANYTVSVEQRAVNISTDDPNDHDVEFLIINKGDYVETQPPVMTYAPKPTLPQTGQLWWPVPVLSASGMIVFTAGWRINSCKRKKNEK